MPTTRKIAGIAGIVFVAVAIVTFVLPGQPPAIEDPNSELLEFLTDHRGAVLLAQWLTFISILPAVLFFGYLVGELRRIDGGQAMRAGAVLLAIAIVAALAEAVAAVAGAAVYEAGRGLGEENARLLWDLAALGTSAQLAAFGVFGLLSGWIIVTTTGLPRWSGWLGVAVGVVGIAASACLRTEGALAPLAPLSVLPGFGGFLLYSVALSVIFLRTEES